MSVSADFDSISDQEKLKVVFNNKINIKPTAKFIYIAYNKRSNIIEEKNEKIMSIHSDPPESCIACLEQETWSIFIS